MKNDFVMISDVVFDSPDNQMRLVCILKILFREIGCEISEVTPKNGVEDVTNVKVDISTISGRVARSFREEFNDNNITEEDIVWLVNEVAIGFRGEGISITFSCDINELDSYLKKVKGILGSAGALKASMLRLSGGETELIEF